MLAANGLPVKNSSAKRISLVSIQLEVEDNSPTVDLSVDEEEEVNEMLSKLTTSRFCIAIYSHRFSGSSTVRITPPRATDDPNLQRASSSSAVGDMAISRSNRGARLSSEIAVETYEMTAEQNGDNKKTETIAFNAGNPYVQKTEGLIHLYKQE